MTCGRSKDGQGPLRVKSLDETARKSTKRKRDPAAHKLQVRVSWSETRAGAFLPAPISRQQRPARWSVIPDNQLPASP
jgi:hypothetical protein